MSLLWDGGKTPSSIYPLSTCSFGGRGCFNSCPHGWFWWPPTQRDPTSGIRTAAQRALVGSRPLQVWARPLNVVTVCSLCVSWPLFSSDF